MADGDQTLIPPAPDNPYPLGRHLAHDPRNRDHRAYTATPQRPPKWSLWWTADVYDQGRESSCTTEAAIGLCRTSPVRFDFTPASWATLDTEAERVAFYRWCQKYDPASWGQHDGSASDSPYKGLRELGHITGWKWLFGIDQVRQWVMWDGPCTVGTVWLQSMFEPRWFTPTGLTEGCVVVVDRTSPVAGGHEFRIVGYSPNRRAFRIVNSWGQGWGDRGRAWILDTDLAWLLDQDGDAVTVTP